MITKMNYLLLSSMMVVAIDNSYGRCCPCEKEEITSIEDMMGNKNINNPNTKNNDKEINNNAYQDDRQTTNGDNKYNLINNEKLKNENNGMMKNDDAIMGIKNSGNEILSNISNKGNKNDHGETNNMSGSNVLQPNSVIVENTTNVGMEDVTGGDKLENDNFKIKRLLLIMSLLKTGCNVKEGCKDKQNVRLKLVTVDGNNKSEEKDIDIQLCKNHNCCNIERCTNPTMYLLQCGHIFCQSHFLRNVHTRLCTQCGITLCGAMLDEYDHQVCAVAANPHYFCNKNNALGSHKVYGDGQRWLCEKHSVLNSQNSKRKRKPVKVYVSKK